MNSIGKCLDVDEDETRTVVRVQLPPAVRRTNTAEPKTQDFIDDYNFARDTLNTVIKTGVEALDGAMNVATESQHPRAFEVASTLLGQLSSAAKDLLSLSEVANKIRTPEETQDEGKPDTYFTGSTKELNALIENK